MPNLPLLMTSPAEPRSAVPSVNEELLVGLRLLCDTVYRVPLPVMNQEASRIAQRRLDAAREWMGRLLEATWPTVSDPSRRSFLVPEPELPGPSMLSFWDVLRLWTGRCSSGL